MEPSMEQHSAVEKSAAAVEAAKQTALLEEKSAEEESAEAVKQSALLEEESAEAAKQSSLLKEESAEVAKQSSLLKEESAEAAKQSSLLKEESAEVAKQSALLEEESAEVAKQSALLEEESAEAVKQSAVLEEESAEAAKQRSLLEEESAEAAKQSSLLKEESAEAAKQSALLVKQSAVLEEESAEAVKQSAVLEEESAEAAKQSSLLEEESSEAAKQSALLEEESSEAAKQSALLEEESSEAAKQSALLEETNAVRQSALPEKTEHAVVEKLWTRVGAAVIILIAIGFAMCGNPFGGPQTLDSRSALQIFQGEFKRLQKDFPEQNDKLWLRSGKMLTNHLNKSHPDEPAMIILTAAQDAKRTLQCLGSGLAQTYAVALNSSWLLIHGPSQAQYDASTAKLNIDEHLSAGFETENRAAVLNRLETLPPGSLLIFFKYCDHENAAYKNVALVFTVLLEDSSLEPDTPLPELEEKVRDFLWQQFVHSVRSNQEMDSDKLSGVWSRISHLVLPVLPVERIETGNCPFDHE